MLASGICPLQDEVLVAVVVVVMVGLVSGDRVLIMEIRRATVKNMLTFSSTGSEHEWNKEVIAIGKQ